MSETILLHLSSFRIVESVFKIVEITLKPFDVCFQIVDTHQREPEKFLIAVGHQRQPITRLPRVLRLA